MPELRDGRSYAPTVLGNFKIYHQARDAVSRLKAAGFTVVVVTNQPDVGRGVISHIELERMHALLARSVPVDRIEVCCHTAEDRCYCRKPAPGMLLRSAADLDIDLKTSYMVGDRASDVDAGRAAGCRTVFVDRAYSAEPPPLAPDHVCEGIAGAADWILLQSRNSLDATNLVEM